MDLTDTNTLITVICGLAIFVGLFGIVVPMLPGLVLCWTGVLVWAVFGDSGWGRWVVLAFATAVALVGVVVKYAWPGRNLKRTGVPNSSIILGGVLGIIGFFVVPVVGLVLGFVLGIWAAERMRLDDGRAAWVSTKAALRAIGLSMLIELTAGLAITLAWMIGVAV